MVTDKLSTENVDCNQIEKYRFRRLQIVMGKQANE